MKKGNKENIYSRKELTKIISKESCLCSSAIYKRINKMIAYRELVRIANDQYVFSNKKIFDYSIVSNVSLKVFDKLKTKLDKGAKYIIYETTLLNMFLNHLIGKSTIIVEVEKELLESVFWFLKEEGFKYVLLNPAENDNYIYNSYDGSCIIIKSLISKSPIDNKSHKTTIEKLVVDIVCDKTLNMFFEGAEISYMVEEILNNYAVKFDSVRNYAKRRHSLDRFVNHVPEELKETFNV